jgi:hypothetical protein
MASLYLLKRSKNNIIMRNPVVLLICLFILGTSCKKAEKPDPGLIVGNWEWVYTWSDGAPGLTNPLTPQNSGIAEMIIFSSDNSYKHSIHFPGAEDLPPDVGSYSIGHSSYTPYSGAYTYSYDSIVYYYRDSQISVDYFKVTNDTLIFCACLRGMAGSWSKTYVKTGD